jgi:hypothetical protein
MPCCSGTDDEPAYDIDKGDEQSGDYIPAHKLAGTIHGAVKIGLVGNLLTALFGFLVGDQAGAQVGIDRHLLARHGIQGKAGSHLGDSGGTLCNHHKVDDDKYREYDNPDHKVALDNEPAEGFNDRSPA